MKVKGEGEQRERVRVWNSSSREEFLVAGFSFIPLDFVMFRDRTESTKARHDAEYTRNAAQMTRK